MEKIYVVTLHKREDLDGFYSDMASDGYRLSQKRPISRNTHYWMTDAQAEVLKQDSRVWDVELRPEELGITPEPFALQNFTTHQQTGTFRKSTAANYTATDFDWGKLHCAGNDTDRGKGTFGGDGTQSKTGTATIFNDGKHVDVVICDNQVSIDMKEWDSGSGSSRYVQYDWYTELNSYVTSIDDDGITIPSPPYNNYFSNSVNETYHGTHVAGTVAGKTYGWAKEANIYSMQVLGNFGGQGTAVNTYLMFDYLRAFHRYKAVNATTGRRNPTITNHSWGYGSTLDPWVLNDLSSIVWRGVTYNSGNPNPSGWTLNGIEADFGLAPSKRRLNSHITAISADVEDAIEDGVVIIGAAGNNDYYMVPQQNPDGTAHQDWDNRAIFNTQGTRYYCRGSSPTSSPSVICVGYIYDDKNFKKNPASNFGPAVDVFAPGTQIISCWGKPGVIKDSGGSTINYGIADTKYGGDPQYCYPISGTSMASPQVCGIAACLATNRERFTNDDVLSYIQHNSKVGDMTFDVGPAGGQSTAFVTVNATGSGAYIVNGNDLNGAVSGNNPTINIHVGDTVEFQQPPSSSMFCQITAVSSPQNSVYTTPGSYSWTCPAGVTSVCVVAIGGGGAGSNGNTAGEGGAAGGGGLGWKNNISVTPGQSYTVVVGADGVVPGNNGGDSYFINTSTVKGGGGQGSTTQVGQPGGTYTGDGGGNGGAGGDGGQSVPGTGYEGGGGGAGGYSGNGGDGGGGNGSTHPNVVGLAGRGDDGSGGSGGGGGYGGGYVGGGVGLLGEGTSGLGCGNYTGVQCFGSGQPGSDGSTNMYGGGGSGSGAQGGSGAVRIIWGAGRSFPSTNTGDQSSAYTIQYSDRTVIHSNPGGTSGPSDNPTINIEVGDAVDFSPATSIANDPIYIKTASTTGSGDQVTTGTTYGQGGTSGTGWDTNAGTTVVPGTYYYQSGNNLGVGGTIVVHAAGTYYNHPLYIKTAQGTGTGNQVTGATNQGSNRAEDVVSWQANAAGTYYYQCALHSGMNGQIVVTAQPGVLGQNGNLSDPTVQKDSPNRYILAVNPRPTSGLIGEVKGSRVPVPKAGTSRQLFPRTRTVYEQT